MLVYFFVLFDLLIFILGNTSVQTMGGNEEQGSKIKYYQVDSNRLSVKEFFAASLSELTKFSYEVQIKEPQCNYIHPIIEKSSLLHHRKNKITKINAEKNNKILTSLDEY